MLSESAQKIIHDYFNLPFSNVNGVRCPYFNNARAGQRGQLRVLIGKGTPKEIVEEAKIISTQYCKDLFDINGMCCVHPKQNERSETDCLRQFLIDNNLGIDCSGFVTQVLTSHFKETRDINLPKMLLKKQKLGFIKKLITSLRPIENTNVRVYADNRCSDEIKITDTVAGDLITMLDTGSGNQHNHVLLITENDNGLIKYVHSRAWSSEGKYGHGVTEGIIKIINPSAGALEQEWVENEKNGEQNETFLEAKKARILRVRRIKI
ncbi:MAG: hypothetical protein AAB348_03440 [Patescibacteria group bacterium]